LSLSIIDSYLSFKYSHGLLYRKIYLNSNSALIFKKYSSLKKTIKKNELCGLETDYKNIEFGRFILK